MRIYRCRMTALAGLLLLVAGATPGRPGPSAADVPFDINYERQQLYNRYYAEREAILARVRSGQLSSAEGQAQIAAANQARFAQARARGAEVDRLLNDMMSRAQAMRESQARQQMAQYGTDLVVTWEGHKNTGTPLGDPTSRGLFGDQDITFRSDADRAAFVQEARARGFTVEGRLGEGYVTVRELDIVAHGPSSVPKDPLSPEARLQTHYRAEGHESFAARGSRYPYLQEGTPEFSKRDALGAVADNLKKVENDLRADPRGKFGLEAESWAQNLAKGTGRAMDAAGNSVEGLQAKIAATTNPQELARLRADLEFRQQLAELKTSMDPRASGMVPPGASDAEASRILQQFQERCLQQYSEAYQAAVQSNRQLVAEMDAKIAGLLRDGNTAAAAQLTAERAAIVDGAAQAIQHLTTGTDQGRLLAEVAFGGRLTPTTRGGIAGYLDPRGNFLSEAEVQGVGRRLMDESRASLRGGGPEAPGARGWSNTERGLIYVGAILAGIQGGLEERDAAAREGRDPSNLLAALRGVWAMTGIQQAFETGRGISKANIEADMRYIEQMIREGKDPHEIRLALLTLTKTLTQVAGHLTGVSSILEGGEEFWKLLTAATTEMKGPPGDINALIAARKEALVAAIEAEISDLEKLLSALDTTAQEAAGKLEALGKADERLSRILSRLNEDRVSIDRIADLCKKNERRRAEIQRLKQQCADALRRAEEAASEVSRAGRELCSHVQSASNSGNTPPASVASAWKRAQDAKKKADDEYGNLAERWGELDSTAKEFDNDDAMIEVLLETTKPQESAQPAASALEALRRAAEDAAQPVAAIQSLIQGVQGRARGIKNRTDLLLNARVMEERASELGAQALGIAERTRGHETRMNGYAQTIRSTTGAGYDALERALEEAKGLEDALKNACPNRPKAVDRSDTDQAYQNSGAGLQAAGQAMDAAKACADNIPGLTSSDFTSDAPSAVSTQPTGGGAGEQPAQPQPKPKPKFTFWTNESRCGQIEIGTVEELNTPRQRGGGECCGCAMDARGAQEPMKRTKLGGEYETDKEAAAALCGMISKRTLAPPTDPWFSWYVEIGGKRYPWGGSCPERK